MKNKPENIAFFEQYVDTVIQVQGAVGLAISIVNADGTVLYEKCHGLRDREKNLPMTADTLLGVASISKSFAALSILQLAEKGILELEAPVNRYIPGFAHPAVRICHLLSHTGGFYPLKRKSVAQAMEAVGLSENEDPYQSVAVAEWGLQTMLDEMNAVTATTGRPGENFSYSNDSFCLLSEIVRLYGGEKTYPDYLKKYVLDPLGMTGSAASLKWSGDLVSQRYQREANGEMTDRWTMYDDQSPHAGAGGVKSTLEDMKKYVLMYLNYGRSLSGARVLSERGIREMMRPRILCELGSYYGYGLYSKEMSTMTLWGHGGDQPGVSAYMEWSEESGIGVVVLCNTSQVCAEGIAKKAMRLASGFTPQESEEGLEPVEWSVEQMDDVCGSYLTGEGNAITITRTGSQFAVNIDGAQTIAFPVNRYMIRVKAMIEDMVVTVYRDENGKVYALGGGFRMIPKLSGTT